MADWTEKHRPETLEEVRGNDKARDQLREWAENWTDHREAVVLHGSPGVGKTSAAYAVANHMGWDTMELNASDERTADAVEASAGRAAANATLSVAADRDDDGEGEDGSDDDAGRQLVIIDEADSLHRHKDRGGASAMTDLVKDAGQPVVLIANEYYEMSRGLRNAARDIEFRDVSKRSIVPVLRDVCRREGVEFDEERLDAIAAKNDGDLRGAIKDLQASVRDGEVGATDTTGDRDRTVDIFALLDAVLKEEDAESALRTAYDADETPDDLLQWVEDKVPKVYGGDELADAYEFLAKGDRWLGRVRATQDYSYWRYVTDDVAAGVAAVRQRDRGGWTQYGGAPYRSSRDATRDHVARQVAEEHDVSMATARREILPFLSTLTHHCKNRELTIRMATRYDLDEGHVAYVTGSGKDTNKVEDIVAEARQRRGDAVVEDEGYFDDDADQTADDPAGDAGDDATTGLDQYGGGDDGEGGESAPDDRSGTGAGDSDGTGETTERAGETTESEAGSDGTATDEGNDGTATDEESDGTATDEGNDEDQSGLDDFV